MEQKGVFLFRMSEGEYNRIRMYCRCSICLGEEFPGSHLTGLTYTTGCLRALNAHDYNQRKPLRYALDAIGYYNSIEKRDDVTASTTTSSVVATSETTVTLISETIPPAPTTTTPPTTETIMEKIMEHKAKIELLKNIRKQLCGCNKCIPPTFFRYITMRVYFQSRICLQPENIPLLDPIR